MAKSQGRTSKVARRVRFWLRVIALIVVVFIVAVIAAAIAIAQDPAYAANGVNGFLSTLGAGAKAVVHAPVDFFGALVNFVERVGN